jgi:hypothetical protein
MLSVYLYDKARIKNKTVTHFSMPTERPLILTFKQSIYKFKDRTSLPGDENSEGNWCLIASKLMKLTILDMDV